MREDTNPQQVIVQRDSSQEVVRLEVSHRKVSHGCHPTNWWLVDSTTFIEGRNSAVCIHMTV